MTTSNRPAPPVSSASADPVAPPSGTVVEGLIEIDGQDWYAIPEIDRMPPFLMSIVSDGDRWAFASSAGPLTAGRGSAKQALFAYETDDRLHAAVGTSGPATAVRIDGSLWRPGRERRPEQRWLAKSIVGDRLLVDERDPTGTIGFRTIWASCDRFGWVRTATLRNHGPNRVRIDVIDGLVGVLPYGLDPTTYQRMSNLTHAYKRNELVDERLSVHSLESPVSDQAEPSEVLRATTVWSIGLEGASVHLRRDAVERFEDGEGPTSDKLVTGRPGAYLLHPDEIWLEPGEHVTWSIVADVARDQHDLVELHALLHSGADLGRLVVDELDRSTDRLRSIMARADGLQCSGDPVTSAHHLANVTYNVMRGGVPLEGYRIDTADLAAFVEQHNRRVRTRHDGWFEELPSVMERRALIRLASDTGDVHLVRLVRQYLPFSFSRRHGDPSRPWNTFSIRVRDEEGNPVVYYEGNWRDVFQNWEALCQSYPEYFPGVISLFASASTADGHNPYRIARDGIDWEVPDPDDPWSNIGYWGDHQLIYLLRLIDASERYLPGSVGELLDERAFTFADVPYRIAAYEDLLRDPKSTIEFDAAADAAAAERVEAIGADGKLLIGHDGELVVTTLMEKLLIAALAKLGNFVPDGGIWMNTQRPEWNDANNALVGYGLSVVTLYHLRQYLVRLRSLAVEGPDRFELSTEVARWLSTTTSTLTSTPVVPAVEAGHHRKALLDQLAGAASSYRASVGTTGFTGGLETVTTDDVVSLCDAALAHLDHTVRSARRPDGLYAGYRLAHFVDDHTIEVEELDPMLEGQVAILGCGALDAEQRLAVIDALFASALFRPDQRSFLLAPPRTLPSFLDKGVLPPAEVSGNPLLSALLAADEPSIVRADRDGRVRFDADLADTEHLDRALDRLAADGQWAELVEDCRTVTVRTYEHVFGHHSFLGRSGSMYAYEGIGSIYWHMVTKLLLAVQESVVDAIDAGADPATIDGLVDAYRRVRDGLGDRKSAREFGAVPTDPYSHTPAHAGAQQPGMTGAVKEELLARPFELGLRIVSGEIRVDPTLLRDDELEPGSTAWSVLDADGTWNDVDVPAGSVGMTWCQVPIVVGVAPDGPHIDVEFRDGHVERRPGIVLGHDIARAVFARTGEIARVRVVIPGIGRSPSS